MRRITERLKIVEKHVNEGITTIMIIGLGSVGAYLLDYLISLNDSSLRIVVVGRNQEKMETKVNIIRVAGTIRKLNKTPIIIEANVDLNDIDRLQETIEKYAPDFIVNSSRAYSGLKYGSISWNKIRAYGIWTPLAMHFTKNIMEACERAQSNAIVINTSYSDAVNPWLKSAGKAYPDFGSGNLNHLIPRIEYAVADMLNIDDFWNIDVVIATGHYHDVCISKEGHAEGVEVPMKIFYEGKEILLSQKEIFEKCKILMPTDATRNMMNASSNYHIITSILQTIRTQKNERFFSPGALGELGGYPVIIGYRDNAIDAWIDESVFSLMEMNDSNKQSMYLDGIANVANGKLSYSDELLKKCMHSFGVKLPETVSFDEADQVAEFIIDNIIKPQVGF